jgi:hypothetical protein
MGWVGWVYGWERWGLDGSGAGGNGGHVELPPSGKQLGRPSGGVPVRQQPTLRSSSHLGKRGGTGGGGFCLFFGGGWGVDWTGKVHPNCGLPCRSSSSGVHLSKSPPGRAAGACRAKQQQPSGSPTVRRRPAGRNGQPSEAAAAGLVVRPSIAARPAAGAGQPGQQQQVW